MISYGGLFSDIKWYMRQTKKTRVVYDGLGRFEKHVDKPLQSQMRICIKWKNQISTKGISYINL